MKLSALNVLTSASVLVAAFLSCGPAQSAKQANALPATLSNPRPVPRPAKAKPARVTRAHNFDEAQNRRCDSLLCPRYIVIGIGF